MLHCLIEVVKGSLSILDYVELPDDSEASVAGPRLADMYFARSSLWHAYERRLFRHMIARGWDQSLVQQALREATQTQAFISVVGECIPNSRHMRCELSNRGVYYPHN
jgi:hypothetical protein